MDHGQDMYVKPRDGARNIKMVTFTKMVTTMMVMVMMEMVMMTTMMEMVMTVTVPVPVIAWKS